MCIRDRESTSRAVGDYIAGMTDNYALEVYDGLFIPRSLSLIHILTDCFCHQNTIIIKGICSLSKTMQGYLTKICETFEEAPEKYPEDFEIRYVD